MKTDKLIKKLNLCESGSTETRSEMLARVFENPALLTPKSAFFYARDVIKGIWPLGEEVIQEDAEYSYFYAYFTKERFFDGEKAIAKNLDISLRYTRDILHGPFPAGEAVMATSAQGSLIYSHHFLKLPFPAGETAIATDAWYSYLYALKVLHDPFPEGETAIARSGYSKMYVRDVLNGDWSRFNQNA